MEMDMLLLFSMKDPSSEHWKNKEFKSMKTDF